MERVFRAKLHDFGQTSKEYSDYLPVNLGNLFTFATFATDRCDRKMMGPCWSVISQMIFA